jgi:hypothetical protein
MRAQRIFRASTCCGVSYPVAGGHLTGTHMPSGLQHLLPFKHFCLKFTHVLKSAQHQMELRHDASFSAQRRPRKEYDFSFNNNIFFQNLKSHTIVLSGHYFP